MGLNKIYNDKGECVGSTDRNPATVFVEEFGNPVEPKYRLIDGNGVEVLSSQKETDKLLDEQEKLTARLKVLAELTGRDGVAAVQDGNVVVVDGPTGPRELALSDEDLARKAEAEAKVRADAEKIKQAGIAADAQNASRVAPATVTGDQVNDQR